MFNLLIASVVSSTSFSPGTESSSRRLGKGSPPSDFPCSVVSALGGGLQQSELSYHCSNKKYLFLNTINLY